MNSNRRSRSAIHQRRQSYTRSPSTNSSQQTTKSDGHPPLERNLSIKEQAAKFFGVIPASDPEIAEQNDLVWQRKRFKHLNNQYGVKPDVLNHQIATPARTPAGIDVLGELVNALPTAEEGSTKKLTRISRAFSIEQKPTGLEKRESVFGMAVDTIKELVNGTPFHSTKNNALQKNTGRVSLRSHQILGTSCSFPTPQPLLPVVMETSFTEPDRPTLSSDEEEKQESPKKGLRRYDPLTLAPKTQATAFQSMEPGRTPSPSRPDRLDLFKPSFPKVKTVNFETRQIGGMETEEAPLRTVNLVDETQESFYDNVAPTRRPFPFPIDITGATAMTTANVESGLLQQPSRMARTLPIHPETPRTNIPMRLGDKLREKERALTSLPERIPIWERLRRGFAHTFPTARTIARVQSLSAIINSRRQKKPRARRQFSSLPFAGSFIRDSNVDPIVKKQLSDESYDERPFFTYWITTAQILILLFGLFRYGFGTTFSRNYLEVTERSGNVLAPTRSLLHLVVYEQNNIWIGPSYANLVHMGAKYAPCMRYDKKIMQQIQLERKKESEDTGCCVSDVGCYQTSDCARRFSQHIKYINDSKYSLTPIRGVCGQDPRYCKNPRSSAPYKWSTNISEWPICLENYENLRSEVHMKCEIQGRPCCIQMHGQCRITTKQYCDFVKGYYHENATLCSQVSCLGDVCGMTPFVKKDNPDQFYRFFTPLFIHAGIIPCILSVWLQFTYMRKFEIMIGWVRLSIIYLVSGIGGYITSAIFIPYMPQVGPVPAQMGVLGAMIINVVYNWEYLQNPAISLLYHLIVAGLLFLFGLFPFIDNFGQIFGFIFGMLLAIPLIPYMGANRKFYIVALPIIFVLVFLVFLLFMFYFVDPDNLWDLSWLTCIPLAPRVCDQQSLQLKNWLPI